MNAASAMAMTHDDEENAPLADAGFVIDSEDRAAWAVDVILSHEERVDRIKRQHVSIMQRAEAELKNARAYFTPMLREWAERNPPRKGRTIRLSTGSLSMRRKPGGVVIEDERAAIEWAESELPEAVRREVVRKLDASMAKRAAERLLSEAITKSWGDLATSRMLENQNNADEFMRELLAKASESLPPGMVRVDDTDTFVISGPVNSKKGGV